MKTNFPKTINELFDIKYGEVGTKSRKEFESKSEANMIAQLVKDTRDKK
jgi:hypothetical protein